MRRRTTARPVGGQTGYSEVIYMPDYRPNHRDARGGATIWTFCHPRRQARGAISYRQEIDGGKAKVFSYP